MNVCVLCGLLHDIGYFLWSYIPQCKRYIIIQKYKYLILNNIN